MVAAAKLVFGIMSKITLTVWGNEIKKMKNIHYPLIIELQNYDYNLPSWLWTGWLDLTHMEDFAGYSKAHWYGNHYL